ncbi:MAG: polysaccharide biosynthesis/export family protein [Planctomycetota bacterium]|jgi:protein involved in polysaccharide export with SLBB domain
MSAARRERCGSAWALACLLLVVPAGGCHSLMNSWLDPSAVGDFANERTLEEPTPEDLVPSHLEYRFVPGDMLIVRVFELLARGTETAAQGVLDEGGNIRLPVIGTVLVAGLTARELEEELIDYLEQNDLIHDAQVIVEPQVRRNATYVVFGATPGPNVYPLPTPNFRLLEALGVAGGLADSVTDVYVFRKETPAAEPPSDQLVPPPVGSADEGEGYRPVHLTDGLGSGVIAASGVYALPRADDPPPDQPTTEPASRTVTAESDETARKELIESIAPAQTQPAQGSAAETQPSTTAPAAVPSQWIFWNGQWIETKPPAADQPAPGPSEIVPAEEPAPEPPQFPRPAVDWAEVAQEEVHRIIQISAEALRNGDPRQNIVIRAGDTLRLLAGEPGEYYMMGQVNRPGAYSFSGRKLTLKSAVAAAGNLSVLAWPQRCTVYRRLGDREEMIQVNLDRIFAGEDADFFIKKDDLIVVGTHPAAVFLAVVRNAFRLSYGFGFVYDRNFADVDITSHNVAAQQKALRASQPRFPGLFP